VWLCPLCPLRCMYTKGSMAAKLPLVWWDLLYSLLYDKSTTNLQQIESVEFEPNQLMVDSTLLTTWVMVHAYFHAHGCLMSIMLFTKLNSNCDILETSLTSYSGWLLFWKQEISQLWGKCQGTGLFSEKYQRKNLSGKMWLMPRHLV